MFEKNHQKQIQETYAETLLGLLNIEDPKHLGVNHYLLLHQKLRELHGSALTDEEIFDRITCAATKLASELLLRGKNVSSFYASEIFEQLEPIVMGKQP